MERAMERRTAFEHDMLYSMHRYQVQSAEEFKLKSASGMQVLFQRTARRNEVALFAWLVRALFRAWRDLTLRHAEQRRKALRYATRWRLKRIWVAWAQSRELDRRHVAMRMQDDTELENRRLANNMDELRKENTQQVDELRRELEDERAAHGLTHNVLPTLAVDWTQSRPSLQR